MDAPSDIDGSPDPIDLLVAQAPEGSCLAQLATRFTHQPAPPTPFDGGLWELLRTYETP